MTDLKARSTDDVLREIERVGEVVDTARRVLLIGGGHRSMLVGQISERLKGLGLVVTCADPADIIEPREAEAVGPLFKTFADILACPSLSHLFGDPIQPVQAEPQLPYLSGLFAKFYSGVTEPLMPFSTNPAPEAPCVAEAAEVPACDDQAPLKPVPAAEAVPEASPDQAPAPVPDIPYRSVLMGYPETWAAGDVFEDHPRYTLMGQRRKWVLVSFDADGVELGRPNTTSTDLITLKTFQTRYVFHSHAQTPAE